MRNFIKMVGPWYRRAPKLGIRAKEPLKPAQAGEEKPLEKIVDEAKKPEHGKIVRHGLYILLATSFALSSPQSEPAKNSNRDYSHYDGRVNQAYLN